MKYSHLQNSNEVAAALDEVIPVGMSSRNICIICIGTDRSTGDSYGPLVGTYLKQLGYKVMGDLDEPVHAMNLNESIERIEEGMYIVAVDASLGAVSSVGTHVVKRGSIKPGAGVGKVLPSVGDVAISAIVNVGGFMEYFVLQNTRLSLVMKLAKDGADAIHNVLTKRNASTLALEVG